MRTGGVKDSPPPPLDGGRELAWKGADFDLIYSTQTNLTQLERLLVAFSVEIQRDETSLRTEKDTVVKMSRLNPSLSNRDVRISVGINIQRV